MVGVGFCVVGVETRRIWCGWASEWAHVGFVVVGCGEQMRESERVRMKEMERDEDEVYFELRVFSSKIDTKVQF